MTTDEAQTEKKAPLLNPLLKLFMVAMVLANTAAMMYSTLLPLYLKELNASVVEIGLFFTVVNIVPLVFQIFGGWISDSLGRLRTIAIGSATGMLSYVGFILAPTWQWVLLGEGLGMITRSMIGPSFGAFIAEQSAEENRARVYGISETIFMIVLVVGPPLGGWIAGQYGFRILFVAAGLLYTVATVLRIFMARAAARNATETPQKLQFKTLKRNLGAMATLLMAGGVMSWILLTDGIADISFSLSMTLEALYLDEIGGMTVQQIGWLTSIFGLANMVSNIPAGWLADKRGERVAVAAGFGMIFIALNVFTRVETFWGYALSWVLFGLGTGTISPAYQSMTSKAVPEKLRGTAFGLIRSSLGIFSLGAPAVGAQLWARVNPQFPFRITALAALITIIPVWLKFNGKQAEAEARALEARIGLDTAPAKPAP